LAWIVERDTVAQFLDRRVVPLAALGRVRSNRMSSFLIFWDWVMISWIELFMSMGEALLDSIHKVFSVFYHHKSG